MSGLDQAKTINDPDYESTVIMSVSSQDTQIASDSQFHDRNNLRGELLSKPFLHLFALCIPSLHHDSELPQVVPKAHAGCVTALLAAPAGNSFFSGGHDGFIRQWRATTGHPIGCSAGMVREKVA